MQIKKRIFMACKVLNTFSYDFDYKKKIVLIFEARAVCGVWEEKRNGDRLNSVMMSGVENFNLFHSQLSSKARQVGKKY